VETSGPTIIRIMSTTTMMTMTAITMVAIDWAA
jgi:hypothetical protein